MACSALCSSPQHLKKSAAVGKNAKARRKSTECFASKAFGNWNKLASGAKKAATRQSLGVVVFFPSSLLASVLQRRNPSRVGWCVCSMYSPLQMSPNKGVKSVCCQETYTPAIVRNIFYLKKRGYVPLNECVYVEQDLVMSYDAVLCSIPLPCFGATLSYLLFCCVMPRL